MAYPRYRFDQRFGPAGAAADAAPEPAGDADPLDRPAHSERALRDALAEASRRAAAEGLERGLEQGRREGEALALLRIEAEAAAALDRLAGRLDGLEATVVESMRRVEAQGAALMVALVRRLAPRLLDATARAEMERVAAAALRAAGRASVLRLRVHPGLADALRARLAAGNLGDVLGTGNIPGTGDGGPRVEVAADDGLAPGALDARWEAGGVRYDPAALDRKLTALVDRALAALLPTPTPAISPDDTQQGENAPCHP